MRLPAITPHQRENERSREQHELWFQAYLDGKRMSYATKPYECEDERLRLSGNGRAFWRQRGFTVRTSTNRDKTILTIWLEPMAQKVAA